MDTPPPDQSPVPPPPTPPEPPAAPAPKPQIGSENPDERQWAMLCHLSGLLGYPLPGFGQILGPLVMWLIRKDKMPFVNQEGKEALNFQISITIYALITGAFMCIGVPLFIAVIVFDVVVVVKASIETSNGRPYRYPLCIRFLQ
jgi:uncharacterized Tic20 family protein